MIMRTPLIVGLDPGTTVGFATLDLDGNLKLVSSSRVMNEATVIEAIVEQGKPVIVATDKHVTPQFVSEVATKVGAVVFSPDNDLLREEKRKVTDSFFLKTGHTVTNDHEMDALASALFAFQSYSALFKKIDRVLHESQKTELSS